VVGEDLVAEVAEDFVQPDIEQGGLLEVTTMPDPFDSALKLAH